MIMMGKSIRQKWVNVHLPLHVCEKHIIPFITIHKSFQSLVQAVEVHGVENVRNVTQVPHRVEDFRQGRGNVDHLSKVYVRD